LAQVKDGDSSFLLQQTIIQFLCSSLQSLSILFEPVLLLVVIRTCWEFCHQYRLAQVKDGDSSFITQQQQQAPPQRTTEARRWIDWLSEHVGTIIINTDWLS
jgi:hypothetical protein